jgi:hypothetical protein
MNSLLKRLNSAAGRARVGCSCALGLAMIAANSGFATGQPSLTVTVRVYNYAEVPNGVLGGAEKEASRIFAAAGIGTEWLDCPTSRVQERSGPAPSGEAVAHCARPLDGTDILLRVLPGSTPARHAFGERMFGFAEGKSVASVFYKRIENLTWGLDGDEHETPVLLGEVIAHEIGHLLLGTNSHSATGIMSARWDREYLRLARMGFQRFSPEQSSAMRETVLRMTGGLLAGIR